MARFLETWGCSKLRQSIFSDANFVVTFEPCFKNSRITKPYISISKIQYNIFRNQTMDAQKPAQQPAQQPAQKEAPRPKDYYAILGLTKNATPDQINEAYGKLSTQWHPDKHTDDRQEAEKKFHDITEAYGVLSDKDKRAAYDKLNQERSLNDAYKIFEKFYKQQGAKTEEEKKFLAQNCSCEPTYYDILEIYPDATIDDINEAFRRLAIKYHPLNNPDDPNALEKFLSIAEAYDNLIDEVRRQIYNDLIFDNELTPLEASVIFQDFLEDNLYSLPVQEDITYFEPRVQKRVSSRLDNKTDTNIENGETEETSIVYTNDNGSKSKKTTTVKTKFEKGAKTTTTTETYEYPNGTKDIYKTIEDAKGKKDKQTYHLKKDEPLPAALTAA